MNFLEIVRKAWQEAGQSGDGPVSVENVSGHQLRFVNWVRDAWIDIQEENDQWVFLKSNLTFDTVSGQESYGKSLVGLATMRDPLAAFRLVDNQFAKLGLKTSIASGDEVCRVNKIAGAPTLLYYDNGVLSFDYIPDGVYTIKVHYRRNPQELAANGDIPICEPTYHRAIVWRAVKAYARFDEDNALFAKANEDLENAMLRMYNALTPKVTFGRSLY